MEGAVLTSATNSSFQNQLNNVTTALCARALPNQQRRCDDAASANKHHTYPRATVPKRSEILHRPDTLGGDLQKAGSSSSEVSRCSVTDIREFPAQTNGFVKLKGALAR